MTMLLAVALQTDLTEYAEPFDTIATLLFVLLTWSFAVGVPGTIAVAAVFWRQRTRRGPTPPLAGRPGRPPSAPAGPPASPATTTPAGPPAVPAPVRGQPLLQLQTLERQVLALRDAAQPVPADEAVRLAARAADLLATHGERSHIGRYAAGLGAIVAAFGPLHTVEVAPDDPPQPPAEPSGTLPEQLRVGLARFAAEGRPVPPHWAFAWYGHLVQPWPAWVDHRRDEISDAFTRHYQAAYPSGGMVLSPGQSTVQLHYAPASARFGGKPLTISTGLPDVANLAQAEGRLRAIGEVALADLPPQVSP